MADHAIKRIAGTLRMFPDALSTHGRLAPAMSSHDHPPGGVGGHGLTRALLLGVAILTGVLLGACQPDRPLERLDPVQDIVAAEVPRMPDEVADWLIAMFGDGAVASAATRQNQFPHNDRLSHYGAMRFADRSPRIRGLAPSDFDLKMWSANNPALQTYVQLSAQQRANDIYLGQFYYDYYWPSEYVVSGRAVPFQTQFIVHLRPTATGRTRIEIIEVLPKVNAGEKWGLGGHGEIFPSIRPDFRDVPPTTRDRIELLNRIVELLSKPDGG